MAIGVDTSKWKPRRLRGTPAAKVRNILSFGIIGFGIVSGLLLHYSKYTTGIKEAAARLYEDPVEEVERRMMIAIGLGNRSSKDIRKAIEESQRPDLPDK